MNNNEKASSAITGISSVSGYITGKKKKRNSNLELYRIIVMFLIVIHHYVVNSGLYDEVLVNAPISASSLTMLILGGWGKVGINCFVMITGYYMCRSHISGMKLLKLYFQIVFYTIIIYSIFCITGHEEFSLGHLASVFFPIHSINSNFIDCFLIFYLLIPFLNILINALDCKKHFKLLVIVISVYSVLPSIPTFDISYNYISWFIAIYLLAAYIRNYDFFPRISHSMWGWMTLGCIVLGSLSVIGLVYIAKIGLYNLFIPYFFIVDSNKLLALIIAVASFMYFKDLHIPHSRFINILGGTTFGILLIHANSDTMRKWLWRDTIDCIGHFSSSVIWSAGYAIVTTLIIFFVCAGIEWFRSMYIEPFYMNLFYKKLSHTSK